MPRNTMKTQQTRGLTLVELLIVIGLLITIASIAIPAVRLINKERKTRETARQATALLASARDSAAVTGFGGVEFVRNRNYVQTVNGQQVVYGCTVMYGLKSLPVFAGDFVGASVAEVRLNDDPLTTGVIEYEIQLDAVPSINQGLNPLRPISVNDTIRLEYRGPRYRISDVSSITNANPFVTIAVPTNYPGPPALDYASLGIPGPAYQIYRKPRAR